MPLHKIRHAVAALLLLGLAGCAGSLRDRAYQARVGFNVGARLVIVARKAKLLDDATYVAAYETMKAGTEALADLDARVARIAAIEADANLSPEAKAAAIAREENGFDVALGVLERLVPLLERWQAEGMAKSPAPGPAPPAPAPVAPPVETFPEPPPPTP